MLRSCQWCGKVHDSRIDCGHRPKKIFQRSADEMGRYTSAWIRKSHDIKERSKWLCAICLDEGVLTYDGLETHHIIKIVDRPDLLLEDSNLICLCSRHHREADRGEIEPERLRRLAEMRDAGDPPGCNDDFTL